jgi:hypothetical protein
LSELLAELLTKLAIVDEVAVLNDEHDRDDDEILMVDRAESTQVR